MTQRIVHIRYSADSGTFPGVRYKHTVSYVGVTPARARKLFDANIRPLCPGCRILSIKRGN